MTEQVTPPVTDSTITMPTPNTNVFDEASVRARLTAAKLLPTNETNPPVETPGTETPNSVPGDSTAPVSAEGDIDDPKERNFKPLKLKIKTLETELETTKAEKQALADEKERIRQEAEQKAEKALEEAQAAKKEAETNAVYREVFELEESPEYKQRFIEPAARILGQLHKFAADYGVSESLIEAVLRAENISEQNKLLSTKFDSLAIQQMSPLINSFRDTMALKMEADKRPMQTREMLRQERERQTIQEKNRIETERKTSKKLAWDEITKVYQEYEYTKEVMGANSGILSMAQNLFDDVVESAALNGMAVVPLEWSKRVAAVSQKAAAFDTVVTKMNEQSSRIKELESALQKVTGSVPGLSTSGRASVEVPSNVATNGILPDRSTLHNLLVNASK